MGLFLASTLLGFDPQCNIFHMTYFPLFISLYAGLVAIWIYFENLAFDKFPKYNSSLPPMKSVGLEIVLRITDL